MTEKSEIDLLYEAAAFCGFKPADGWPAELNPRQLAALMAGGLKEPHKQAYRVSLRMITDAIEAGSLSLRRQSRPPVEIARDADDLSEYARFSKATFPSLNGFGRARLVYYEKLTQPDTLHIDRSQCAAWLRAIRKAPSEYIRAWLGPVWQEEGQGASKVDGKKESIRSILQRIGDIDSEFSPDAMPGIKGDFFALCKKLDRENFAYISQATFDGYLSGICKFRKGSRHSDYYEKIEAQMGVKSVKPL